jgi:hypothetical protein
MNGNPHLPANIRQWNGDSRGHWEGTTLVIDVTNFGPKADFEGSRENLHLVERWTRTGPNTVEYEVTIEDPTVWTSAWTVRQEFTRQSEQENRIYYEPRCIEGNYAFPSMLLAARQADRAFAEGRGPDPATRNSVGPLVVDSSVGKSYGIRKATTAHDRFLSAAIMVRIAVRPLPEVSITPWPDCPAHASRA